MGKVELMHVIEKRAEAAQRVEAKMAPRQRKLFIYLCQCCWEVLLHVSICVRVRALTLWFK